MKNRRPSHALRRCMAYSLIAALNAQPHLSQAAVTDLASAPLADSAASEVKPNIMFILDDSGSMDWDYMPDYVNDSNVGCFDAGDDSSGTITGSPDACRVGDPPFMSRDFNGQYYNPAISYSPALNYDGTSKPTQNAANTANWTAVLTDAFGIQNKDQLGNTVTTRDLTTQYPDRVWCTDPSDAAAGANCKKNAAYSYPDAAYPYGLTGGGSVKYVFGAPYYYGINPTEHCTTADLTSCTASTVPTGAYIFPARVRWCSDAALTTCQAKRLGSFTRAKYLGTVTPGGAGSAAVAATATVTIGNSGSDNSVNISSLTVNGVNIISATVTASTGTNSSTERTNAATALKNAINSFVSTPDYSATSSGAVVTISAPAPGPAYNGYAVAVGSSAAGVTAATATVTIGNSGSNASVNITGLTINGAPLITSAVTAATGTNASSERTAAATALRNAINAYGATSGYGATSSGNVVTISASVAEGASANNRLLAKSGTLPVTISDCSPINDALCGGVTSGGIPVTSTNFTGGADAIPPSTDTRVGVGQFSRTDIVSSNDSYPKAASRTDCAGATCTYAEEMTNFANWYAYYRTRMQTMKSAASRSFSSIDNAYRVGFITINPGSPVSSGKYLAIGDFAGSAGGQKHAWYNKLFGISPGGGTPLREALSRVGRHYAHITSGINNGMSADPMQYSCQQNFSILTTDGYWNGAAGQKLDGTSIGEQDNVEDTGAVKYVSRASGTFDGNIGASSTLADVAMYYYKTDLRTSGSLGALGSDVSLDNVPTSSKDLAPHQHMTTFTLGLGLDGAMSYRPDYESADSGDFHKIVNGETGCSWTGGTCNWPLPVGDTATALDDLWHAAVNGRGVYFSARDPTSLAQSLSAALAGVQVRTGAAAASATSSPNITETDRFIYSSTYRTVKWDGEVTAQLIDTSSGNVLPDVVWSAQALLDNRILTPSSDDRTIHLFDSGTATQLKPFQWTDLTATEKAYFNNKCASLSQCGSLAPDVQATANSGQILMEYLRGHTEHDGEAFRNREHVFGDPVNATPAYVRVPPWSFADAVTPDYPTFKAANASRPGTLYVAANDGMLHAFNGDTGQESWAYIPRMVLSGLYKLADNNYGANHQYFVDGSPETMDVFTGSAWKTILVAGLGGGGRGYYALDVTDPANPKGLWEFCHDSSLCAVSDSDLGYSYGNPVITKRASDGTWVVIVASGYNNVSPGTGRGYLYVLNALTGAVLQKIDTGEGSTTTPLGLSKLSQWTDNGAQDNTTKWVYAGDLEGNLWRFDFTAAPATALKLATLKDGSGKPQSVTSRLELANVYSNRVIFVGTGRYLGVDDLVDPATLVPPQPYAYQQSFYAIKDTGAFLGDPRAGGTLVAQTLTALDANNRTLSANAVDWTAKNGWYVDFNPSNATPGERVNLDPQLVLGTLLVTTNVPGNSACSVGGSSWFYLFNYLTGSFVASSPGSVGGSKLADAIAVGNVVIRLPSGALKTIATTATGAKLTVGVHTSAAAAAGGKRVSWREIIQ